jgi:glutathione S-transferase
MPVNYEPIEDIIEADGLRLILLQDYPSPWGQAAKAMSEYKALPLRFAALLAGQANTEIKNWSGTDSAPVMAWNKETPINKWDEILMLLERLAPQRSLVPLELETRIEFFSLADALCGYLGFGWNRRLAGIQAGVDAGIKVGEFGKKYGYNATDGQLAEARSINFLLKLKNILERQAQRGSRFIIGDTVTALDFYWAAFSNLVRIQSAQDCPLKPEIRSRFEKESPSVAQAIDRILLDHRDFMMRKYFKLPMEV